MFLNETCDILTAELKTLDETFFKMSVDRDTVFLADKINFVLIEGIL